MLRSGEVADRYLYLTLAGLGLALAGLLTAHARVRTRVLAAAALCALGAVLVGLTLPSWRDDRSLWQAAVTKHPSPYTWGGLARTLEDEGALDDAAAAYRQATTAPHPFAESCYRVAAIHLKRQDPAAAAQAGRRALTQGCAPSPELLAPTAVGLFIIGSVDEAEAMAGRLRSDPTGLAVLVRLAAAARRGDIEPFFAAQASGAGDPEQLRAQVAWLLDQAQLPEVAEVIREATPTPPDAVDAGPPGSGPGRPPTGGR